MASIICAGYHLVSPYGEGVKYEPNENTGFYVNARNKDVPDGWGDPRTAEDGSPIKPGTAGGANHIQYVTTKKNGDWVCQYKPGTQLYGTVDWEGPWYKLTSGTTPTDNDKKKGRIRLTFSGPKNRLFPDKTFSYGSDEKHNYIYYRGKCAAVAPGPVLGACLRKIGADWWIFVAVKAGPFKTSFYKKQFITADAASKKQMTDDWINNSKSQVLTLTSKRPWIFLSDHSPSTCSQGDSATLEPIATPWHFNESGTEAVHMRECTITFQAVVTGDTAAPIQQPGYNLYKATIDSQYVTVQDLLNDTNAYKVTLSQEASPRPNYTPTCRWPDGSQPSIPHVWEVHSFKQDIEVTGKYNVAADYHGDIMVVYSVKAAFKRQHETWWYKGRDYTILQYPNYAPYCNQGDRGGNAYGRPDDYTPGDGRSTNFINVSERLDLVWTGEYGSMEFPLVERQNGTYEEYQGLPRDPNNNVQYFLWEFMNYIQYLKGRYLHSMAYSTEKLRISKGNGTQQMFDNERYQYIHGGLELEKLAQNDDAPSTQNGAFGLSLYDPPATWNNSFMNSQEYKSFSLDMEKIWEKYPRYNGLIDSPDPRGEYSGVFFYATSKTLTDQVQGVDCQKNEGLGVGATDDGKCTISLGYKKKESDGSLTTRYVSKLSTTPVKGATIDTNSVVDAPLDTEGNVWFFDIGVK